MFEFGVVVTHGLRKPLSRSSLGCKPLFNLMSRTFSELGNSNNEAPGTATVGTAQIHQKKDIYNGTYTTLLKILRRSSLTTATLSVTTLPAMIMISGNLPSAGMSAIVGTAVVMSVGSTLFLNAMSYPYVTKLAESPNSTPNDRKLIAYRLGLLGKEYPTELRLADVESVRVSDHPFASFQIKKDYFFVFEKMIEDDLILKETLDRKNSKNPISNPK